MIEIRFVGIDGFHRPIFKDDLKNYYGSTDKLFNIGDSSETVLESITEKDVTFFGRRFGCEPMGTPVDDIRIVR